MAADGNAKVTAEEDYGEVKLCLSQKLETSVLRFESLVYPNREYIFRRKKISQLRNGQCHEYWMCITCEEKKKEKDTLVKEKTCCCIVVSKNRIVKNPDVGHHSQCKGKTSHQVNAMQLSREARDQCRKGRKRPIEAHENMHQELSKRFGCTDDSLRAVGVFLPQYQSAKAGLKRWFKKGRNTGSTGHCDGSEYITDGIENCEIHLTTEETEALTENGFVIISTLQAMGDSPTTAIITATNEADGGSDTIVLTETSLVATSKRVASSKVSDKSPPVNTRKKLKVDHDYLATAMVGVLEDVASEQQERENVAELTLKAEDEADNIVVESIVSDTAIAGDAAVETRIHAEDDIYNYVLSVAARLRLLPPRKRAQFKIRTEQVLYDLEGFDSGGEV